MIYLDKKSVENIVKIHLPLDKKLDIKPNEDNQIYTFNEHLVHYQMQHSIPEFRKFGHDISEFGGTCSRRDHLFIDYCGEMKNFHYWQVEIWDQIPEEFRDIIFFHEAIELDGMSKDLLQPEAHKIARVEEEKYFKKYFNHEEQKRFLEMNKELGLVKN